MIQIVSRMGPVAVLWTVGLALGVALSAGVVEAKEEGWDGKVIASITAQTGSVDTFAGTIDALGERKWEVDLATLRFVGVYGTSRDRENDGGNPSNDDVVQDTQALTARWKRSITDRFFWLTGSELSRDSTIDREVRATLRSGPGYRVWMGDDADTRHLDISAGFGYRYELYDGNTGPAPEASGNCNVVGDLVCGNGTDANLAEVIAGFEYKNLYFEDRVKYSHTGSVGLPVNDTNAYIVRTEMLIGIPLSEAWSFDTGFFYEYVNDVPEDQNPSTFRTTVGLGYSF